MEIWKSIGKPLFRRRPNKYLINSDMYDLMNEPIFLSLAKTLLESEEISMHGVFNARCQFPFDQHTKTPVHQDSQYWFLDYGKGEQLEQVANHKIVTFWFPLQKVTEKSGAMQVISRDEFGNKLFENHKYGYEKTGFIGLTPNDLAKHQLLPINLERGDLLIFDEYSPHGACENISEHIRWSMDIRYELTETRPAIGEKFGFELSNTADNKDAWLAKAQR